MWFQFFSDSTGGSRSIERSLIKIIASGIAENLRNLLFKIHGMDEKKRKAVLSRYCVTGLFFGNGTIEAINSVVELFNDKKYVAIQ